MIGQQHATVPDPTVFSSRSKLAVQHHSPHSLRQKRAARRVPVSQTQTSLAQICVVSYTKSCVATYTYCEHV